MLNVELIIDSDGASNKKGNGGAGVIINMVTEHGTKFNLMAYQIACEKTTNNQMEMFSAMSGYLLGIYALDSNLVNEIIQNSYIKDTIVEPVNITKITINSDSQYTVKGLNEWIDGWRNKGWRSTSGAVKNKALWEAFFKLKMRVRKDRLPIKKKRKKGHNGDVDNEIVDIIAKDSYLSTNYKHGDSILLYEDFNHKYLIDRVQRSYEFYNPAVFYGLMSFTDFDKISNSDENTVTKHLYNCFFDND